MDTFPDDAEEEARAVDALAMRIQPMLAEGRVAEVQTILLKALTQPETRQRALSLLDYLTNEGAIFTIPNRSQVCQSFIYYLRSIADHILLLSSSLLPDVSFKHCPKWALAHFENILKQSFFHF